MTPTHTFRWVVRKNVVTAAEVTACRDAHGVTLAEAKAALVNEHPPVLQQWWADLASLFDSGLCGGEWRDVPTEYEPHPTETADTPRASAGIALSVREDC